MGADDGEEGGAQASIPWLAGALFRVRATGRPLGASSASKRARHQMAIETVVSHEGIFLFFLKTR